MLKVTFTQVKKVTDEEGHPNEVCSHLRSIRMDSGVLTPR